MVFRSYIEVTAVPESASQKVHPSSYARSSRARRSGSVMRSFKREQGNPMPMVPKPIHGTRGPFLPNGRSTGEGDFMVIWPCVKSEWWKRAGLSYTCAMMCVEDTDRIQLLRVRYASS